MKVIQAVQFVFIKTFKAAKKLLIIYITTQIILSLTYIVNIFLFKEIIDTASHEKTILNLSIMTLIVLRLVYEVINKFIEKFGDYLWNLIDIKQTIYNNQSFIEKLSTLDLVNYEDPETHDLIWRAFNRFQWYLRYYLDNSIKLFTKIIELSASIAIFFYASPFSALFIVLANIFPVIVKAKLGTEGFNLYKADSETKKRFGYITSLITEREALIEVKQFQGFSFLKKQLLDIYKGFAKRQKQLYKKSWINLTLVEIFPLLAIFAFLIVITHQLQTDVITSGTFVFLFTNMFVFAGALNQLSHHISVLFAESNFIHDAIDFFAIKPNIEYPRVKKAKKEKIAKKIEKPTIVVENLSFSYPNSDTLVLKDINLTIPYGQNLALIGENGAGKTTLVKLLMRVYDPTQGRILINDVDLKEIPENLLYNLYSTIFQSFGKFYLTIRENLELAAGRKLPDKEYIRALKTSNAWSFVKELPNKIDNQLGPTYTDGVDLSGGQWQQLAIAKAIIKKAPVLILDEPTAAVDAKAEMQIFDRLNRETKDKTVIFISHRFSTIKDAERIVVIEDGKIIEDGTHRQLMSDQNKYAKLYTIQAERYKRE